MKARDLIKVLQENPEADILIDAPESYHPVEAAVYKWGQTYVVTTQAMIDATEKEKADVRAFLDLAFDDLVADGQEYYTHAVEREDC